MKQWKLTEEQLIEAYPNAKVVLNGRAIDPWYKSIVATFGQHFRNWSFRYLSLFDPGMYWLKQVFMLYEHGYYQGSMVRNAPRIYKEHYAMVRGSVPPERLLEWKVEDGWEPLCRFLGKEVPEQAFPNGNTPAQMFEKGRRLREREARRAWRNIGVLLMAVTGVGIAGVLQLRRK